MNIQIDHAANMKKIILIKLIFVLGISPVAISEGTWTRKANMSTARYVLSSGVVDGKLYAIGGDTGGGNPNIVEEYDPAIDQWAKKSNLPIGVGAGASGTVNDKIYLIGGLSSQWSSPSSRVQVYDAMTDRWSTKANMPTARGWLSVSVVNGKIYAIGGALAFNGTVVSAVEEYDPATNTWTKKADMPTARACLSTSVANGKIYAIGGILSNQWSQAISKVEEYDPVTDTWVQKSDIPTRRSYFSTSVLKGKIYAIGGYTSSYNAISSVEKYDPVADVWSSEINMPTPRWGLSTSVVNGKIFAIGGRSVQGNPYSIVEEYDTGLIAAQPDFNGDGIIDMKDLLRVIESWGQQDQLCDIAPPPFGDGIVDALDLELLMSCWEQHVDDPTLVAQWALDETEGNIAVDSASSSGFGDGYIMGEPLWLPDGGQVGGAIQLDGTDDFIITSPVFNPSYEPFSILAWIKGGAPGQVVISEMGGSDWLSADPLDGHLMTELAGSGRSAGPMQSRTAITDGSWHRIGFVWNGSTRILFVDSVEVARDTQDDLQSLGTGIYIGTGKATAPGTYWSGLIDDVRIYNRVVQP